MELQDIMTLRQNTSDKDYAAFLSNDGWKYETEEEARSGYGRMAKSRNGTPLTMEEFLSELGTKIDATTAQRLYDTLLKFVNDGALSPYKLYQYAKFKWCAKCPEAIIAYQIGPKRWAVNNCSETITEERAKLLVSADFGFEISRIKLLSTPYYDATDWNFISFRCGPYDWLMCNAELHKIYQ